MPLFFYHLKFELYPAVPGRPSSKNGPFWVPEKTSSIFDNLPSHPRQQPELSKSGRKERHGPNPKLRSSVRSELTSSVIDCGTPRPTEVRDGRNIVVLSERQRRQRTLSFPPPQARAAINPKIAVQDWRFGPLSVESLDIDNYKDGHNMEEASGSAAAAAMDPSLGSAGMATKAKYIPLATSKNTEIGWGIVHLYREEKPTPELALPPEEDASNGEDSQTEVDCTTICIPAVPSYLSPSDFLGFIGEKWRDQISHYRMVMTGRMNRYLVLMKFRNNKKARSFGREFDGKVFNQIEPETCNVAFVRSITFETPTRPDDSFPDLSQDPFTPSAAGTSGSLKPFPPPTPNLIELPTCPVCLERMDDTTGLLTIPCQHVFHCSCLQKWKGSGCPVCRHTNPSTSAGGSNHFYSSTSAPQHDTGEPFTQPFGSHVSNLCSVCDTADDLWICLICGNVGCGRYKGGHAKEHWKDTAHTFALEIDTQHVWDYAGDIWVHRLIRDKGDGKVVELPGHQNSYHNDEQEDVVPRAKLDSIGMEYTHLLTSQLESQRVYFEDMLSKAADKATKASIAAETAASQTSEALKELRALREEQRTLRHDLLPSLEKDVERERSRAVKSTDLARGLGKSLQEEKKVSEGLMRRIEHVNKEVERLGEQAKTLQLENADLKDQNHDLTMFISGQEKLKELEAEGKVDEGEIQEGTVALPEEKKRRKGKGKAKG